VKDQPTGGVGPFDFVVTVCTQAVPGILPSKPLPSRSLNQSFHLRATSFPSSNQFLSCNARTHLRISLRHMQCGVGDKRSRNQE